MYKTVALTLAVSVLQGCGNSGDTVPMVKGESAFTCRQLSMAEAQGNDQTVSKMTTTTMSILDRAYTEDTPIQHFYRELVRKDLDYAVQHRQLLAQTCSTSADLSLTDAAGQALNNHYARAMAQPRWATCRALNEGDIGYDAIMKEMSTPTAIVLGGDGVASNVLAFTKAPKYGAEYVRKQVEDYCEVNPGVRIWKAFDLSLAEERQAEMEEYTRQREAEEARIKEERRQAELAEYGKDLTKVGKASCSEFKRLLRLTDEQGPDQSIYVEALTNTIRSVAEPMESHQKIAFEQAMEDPTRLGRDMAEQCNAFGVTDNSLHGLLMATDVISLAKSDAMKFLSSLLKDKEGAVDCERPNDMTCRSRLEVTAATEAIYELAHCERKEYREGVKCFADPQIAYDYQIARLEVSNLTSKQHSLDQQLAARLSSQDLEPELESCKQALIAKGFRGDEFYGHAETECETPIKEARKAPIRKALLESTNSLDAAKVHLEALAVQGSSMQPD